MPMRRRARIAPLAWAILATVVVDEPADWIWARERERRRASGSDRPGPS